VRADSKALAAFFLIACVPPWIGWSLLRFGVVPSTGAWQMLYLTGWAASAAGLVATHIEEGGRGVSRLLREAVRFAVPVRWWLFVLFVPVLAISTSALLYAGVSGKSVGFDPVSFAKSVAPGALAAFMLGPFGEEFGWRGYLLPRLAHKMGVVSALLVVGVIWGVWHWPLLYQSVIAAPVLELVTLVVGIAYMSVVIGTVYLRTGSLFLAMLLHWNINGMRDVAGQVFPGLPAGSDPLLQWCSVGANALVAILILFALKRR
jgi:membrane protease YdiL (CAAX protease family)